MTPSRWDPGGRASPPPGHPAGRVGGRHGTAWAVRLRWRVGGVPGWPLCCWRIAV